MNTEISSSKKNPKRSTKKGFHPLRWLCYSALVFALTVLGILLAFRYYGLPEQIGERLRDELAKKGMSVDFKRLYLDPLGRVVAEDLQVRRMDREMAQKLIVEKLSFSFNWISWWRGESFLEAASLSRADLVVPLDETTSIKLQSVYADVEFRPQQVVVRDFRAILLNLRLHLSGTLDYTDYKPGPPMTEEQVRARAAAWRTIDKILGEIQGSRPISIDIEGEVLLAKPEESRVRLVVDGRRQQWRGLICEKFTLDARFEERLCRVEMDLGLLRGGVRAETSWLYGGKKSVVSFESDADLSLLAPVLPGALGAFMKDVRFRSLPVNEGSVELDWNDGLKYLVMTRSNWKDFAIKDAYFDSLYLPVSYDGKRILIPGLTLRGNRGQAEAELYYDGVELLKAKLDSTIDPTQFAALFGPKAQPFFDSLKFRSDGPSIQADIVGKGLKREGMTVQGTLHVFDFSYKGVDLQEVRTSFQFQGDELDLPDIYVRRAEGDGSGAVKHNFATRIVKLQNVKARLHLRETARVISSKLEEYAEPYRFIAAPYAEASGTVDVDNQKLTDLKVHVVAPEGMIYRFLGKDITLTDLDADLAFKGAELSITGRKPVTLFGGKLEAVLGLTLKKNVTYRVKGTLTDSDFGALMRTYFENSEISGTLGGQINLRGRLDDTKSIDGFGTMTVKKGTLYDIPIFGGFSQILNSIVPNLGYAVADKALAEYIFKDGVIQIDKVDVYSSTFALIGKGSYNYIEDDVDLSMRVNMRGLMGIALFPVSKLFEYEGKGSLNDTKWSPKVF